LFYRYFIPTGFEDVMGLFYRYFIPTGFEDVMGLFYRYFIPTGFEDVMDLFYQYFIPTAGNGPLFSLLTFHPYWILAREIILATDIQFRWDLCYSPSLVLPVLYPYGM
jgi:hypothetical protein